MLDDLSFWKRCALILAVIALAGLLDGCGDARDAVLTASFVSDADDRKSIRPDQLSHPLPCDFTMRAFAGYEVYEEVCYRRRTQ